MASLEIDPLLRKGFRLLHSRSKDSAEQLRALLEEAQRQRHGKTAKDPYSLKKESPIPRSKQSSPSNLSKGNAELKREISHKGRDDDSHSKRAKLSTSVEAGSSSGSSASSVSSSALKSHTPSPTPSARSSEGAISDGPDCDTLADEIGINCTVCKRFEQTSGNQLLECQECHSLFHQECHKPPVSHQDKMDPRLVWYCSKCSRAFRKQQPVPGLSSSSGGGLRSASTVTASSSPSLSKGRRNSPFANLSSSSVAASSSSSLSSRSNLKPTASASPGAECSNRTWFSPSKAKEVTANTKETTSTAQSTQNGSVDESDSDGDPSLPIKWKDPPPTAGDAPLGNRFTDAALVDEGRRVNLSRRRGIHRLRSLIATDSPFTIHAWVSAKKPRILMWFRSLAKDFNWTWSDELKCYFYKNLGRGKTSGQTTSSNALGVTRPKRDLSPSSSSQPVTKLSERNYLSEKRIVNRRSSRNKNTECNGNAFRDRLRAQSSSNPLKPTSLRSNKSRDDKTRDLRSNAGRTRRRRSLRKGAVRNRQDQTNASVPKRNSPTS